MVDCLILEVDLELLFVVDEAGQLVGDGWELLNLEPIVNFLDRSIVLEKSQVGEDREVMALTDRDLV